MALRDWGAISASQPLMSSLVTSHARAGECKATGMRAKYREGRNGQRNTVSMGIRGAPRSQQRTSLAVKNPC